MCRKRFCLLPSPEIFLNSASGCKAPTELLFPWYLQFAVGVSEPLAGVRTQLYPALQNKMKTSALIHPPQRVCTGLEAERAKQKEKEGRHSQPAAETGLKC